jgi:hypothetical protein
MTSAKIYARTNLDDARPNERAFRVIRYYDRGGWVVEASSAKGEWEKVCTRYTLAGAIHVMDQLASEVAKGPHQRARARRAA